MENVHKMLQRKLNEANETIQKQTCDIAELKKVCRSAKKLADNVAGDSEPKQELLTLIKNSPLLDL